MKLKPAATAVLCLALLTLLAYTPTPAISCFDPTGNASIEVVLNKPGASYNLSVLEELGNIVAVDHRMGKAYAYRSHVSSNIVVVVSLQPLAAYSAKPSKHVAVRVESLLAETNTSSGLKTYRASYLTSKAVDAEALREAASGLGFHLSMVEVGEEKHALAAGELYGASILIYIVLGQSSAELTVYVMGEAEDGEALLEALEGFVEKLAGGPVTLELEEIVVPGSMKPKADGKALRKALAYEVGWLSSLGVVSGITADDIEEMGRVAIPGYAGWNSRLVYYGGLWLPYYRLIPVLEGAALLRAEGCSWSYPPEKLPPEPPAATSTTAQSPGVAIGAPYGYSRELLLLTGLLILAILTVAVFSRRG